MEIVECNVPVKSAAAFFSGMCAPDALARYYNPFGKFFFRCMAVQTVFKCSLIRPRLRPCTSRNNSDSNENNNNLTYSVHGGEEVVND